MKLAQNLSRLGTETAFKVLAEAKGLEKQGKKIIHLSLAVNIDGSITYIIFIVT